MLEKQLIDKERIEMKKEEKLADISKKMEINVRRMIEKERMKEALGVISKSPESSLAKKKLFEFQVIAKKTKQ